MLFLKLIVGGGLLLSETDIGVLVLRELGFDTGVHAVLLEDDEENPQFNEMIHPDGRRGVEFDFNAGVENLNVETAPEVIIIESDDAAAEIPSETTRLVLTSEAVTDKSMAFAAKLENLEYLEVTHCPVTVDGIRKIEHLASLTTLNLTGTKVDDRVAESINRLPKLELLVLSKTAVTNQCLIQLHGSPELKTLRLSETNIDDDGIPHLKKFPNLTNLSIRDLDLSDRALVPLSQLQELRILDLSGTKVGQDLSAFAHFENLQMLELNRTHLVPTELRHLEQSPRLILLGLIDAGVDDRAIPHLSRLRFPYGLSIGGTKISSTGVDALRKSLPYYEIDTEHGDVGEFSAFERTGWADAEDGTMISAGKFTSVELEELEKLESSDPTSSLQITDESDSP
jgi:Leucine-rich repeat (LRR) protein